ncbi:MAG: hypothetical protein GXY70_07410 [Euryarchaeota archaeon]|nr:hypothetical protein [Euryarchaeota archaeon]
MSMIRTVSYKASIQADGSIYNESIEMSAEIDSMPLAQSQLDDAGARVDQLRQAILAKRKQWEGPAPEAPKEQPKPSGQNTIDGSKAPANAPVIKCIKCGTQVEPKTSQKGVEYSYCPKCKDNRRKDGTEFPPKGA